MTFRAIADIKARNEAAGNFWFSKDTLRFFNSEVYSGVYGSGLFITSERMELHMPKLYSVRYARPDGDIATVGKFQGHNTLGWARKAAKQWAAIDAFFGGKP